MILHEKTKQEFGYDFETATIRSCFYCICDYCGKEFKRCKKTITQCNKIIPKDSCGTGGCKRKKNEEVQLVKFGVKNTGGSQESLEKRKKTSIEKYGSENYINSQEYKNRNQKKYGVDYTVQVRRVKDKVKETRIKNYGVNHHTKSSEYQKKLRQKCLEKYGVDHFSKTEEFKNKVRNTFLAKYGVDSIFKSEYFLTSVQNSNNYGKSQEELKEFFNSIGLQFTSNRHILNGKEIDLYNKELGIGVEYCGLYWHNEMSPQPRTRRYHYDKYRKCKDQGVKLITIFEDEWRQKRPICESILKSNVGCNLKIYARKCVVKELEVKDFNVFCEKYHLLGKPKNTLYCCGLVHGKELVAAMSLGKHHRGGKSVVLSRLCFKSDLNVIGGANKLLSLCEKWCNVNGHGEIITWSDNRWSSGKVYEKMGFVLDKELPPDYSYVLTKGGSLSRLSKQSCKKTFPSSKTEREIMAELGYSRIWDCGKIRWKKVL